MVSLGRLIRPLFSNAYCKGGGNVENYNEIIEQTTVKFNRENQEAWDYDNLRTVSTRLRTADADAFRDACMRWGDTPYSYLKRHILRDVLGRNWPKDATPVE